ncbi:MAG TPA: hypothetical protein VID47_02590 [Actinomycetota bacterium]
MTGVELVVSLVVLGLVASGIVGVLWSVAGSAERFDRAEVTREAAAAVRAVDGGIRSGTALYPPTDGGMGLVVASAPDARTGVARCEQWRIVGVALERREWRSDWRTSGGVGMWRTVARDVVNRAPPGAMPVPAFAFGTGTAAKDVVVSIVVNHGVDASHSVRVTRRVPVSSVAPEGRCDPVPN